MHTVKPAYVRSKNKIDTKVAGSIKKRFKGLFWRF